MVEEALMAMEHEVSIEIDRPIDQVFDYTNNNVAEWSKTVVEDEVLDDKRGVGTKFRCVTEDHGRRMDFDGVVTQWDPPRASAVKMVGKSFDIEARYTFEDLGGRTRVTQHGRVQPKGMFKVLFFLLGWMFHKAGCRAAQEEFESLKRKLEARPAAA
jgi:uncharacterized membrane protein